MKKRQMGIIAIVLISTGIILVTGDILEENGKLIDTAGAKFFGGKIILVDDDFTDDPENHKWDTIQEGINDSANGDMVYVYEGTYNENIIVDRAIDLIGEEKDKVTINGGGIEATVNISADWVNMSGFTISNADDGGVIINGMNASISNCGINSETYGVIINGVNADISNCTINSKTYGILNTVYGYKIGTSIYNCEIYNSKYGLNLTNSSGFILSNCTVHDTEWGIWFKQFSNVTIRNSILYNSENKSILIGLSSEIIIEKCDLYDSFCGIGIRTSSNISINNSSIHDNLFGIRLSNSSYNIITNSTISENTVYGTYIMDNSNNNSIHRNNFIDNINHAFPEQVWDNCNNTWDNGYPSGGNYWSDYTGVDNYKGPDQNISGSDGIGDTPYNISGDSNQDRYPLMNLVGYPVAYFSFTPTENITTQTNINFTDESIDLNGNITSWYWEFGDGNSSYIQNPTHQYADNGNYTIDLTVTDDDGHKNTTSKSVTVENVPPIANFTWSPTNPITTDTVQFADQSNDPDGTVVSWYWEFGDGNITYKKNSSHKYGDNGTYQVNLTVWDNDGANDTISKNITVVNAPPIANFTWSPGFPTDRDIITFTDVSNDPDGSIVNWTWDFGDGNISWKQNTSHQYADNGTYNVTLTVEDNDGDNGTLSQNIMVSNIPPIVYFTWSPSNPKTDTTITFDASNSFDPDGTIQLYEWNWDNDSEYDESTTSPTTTHSWSNNGNYPVTLRATDNDGATDTKTRTVTVENRPPIADFTFTPSNPEPRETISFSSNCYDPDGSISRYSWGFGDGTSSSFSDPKHIYSDNEIYYVSLTVWDDDDASSTKWKTINVNIPPVADFTYSPATPTDLVNITFNDTSIEEDGKIVSYKWNFGDGNTSTKQNATHRYADNGNYTVTLTIEDDNGVTDEKSRNITVRNVKPTAYFSYTPKPPPKINKTLNNITLNFIDNSTDPDGNIVNWTWNFGDGNISYGNQTNHTYSEKGDYNVTLTVTDNDEDKDAYTATITIEKEKKKKEEGIPGFEFAPLIIAIALIALITLFRHRPNKPYRY